MSRDNRRAIAEVEHPYLKGVPPHDRYFLDAIEYGHSADFPPQLAEFTEAMTFLRDAFLGIRSVDDACARFAAEVNAAMTSGAFG